MFSDRLSELEQNLKSLYEQRYALEQGALMTPDDEKRMQNEQKIRDKIRPKIREYEQEYLQELDTENFLRQHFPTFTRLVKGAKK